MENEEDGPDSFDPGEGRGMRILIADDEELVREALGTLLKARGHRVEVVASGHEAHDVIANVLPDAAVLDWKMPGGGEKVARSLLETPEFQGPVVVISGSMGPLELPFRDERVSLVSKPFSFRHLIEMLEREERPTRLS